MESERRSCPNCGAAIAPEAAFCEACGKRVAAAREGMASGTPFALSVALPKAMQVGRWSNVIVRFRAAADIYESVEFVLRCGDDEIESVKCCEGRPLAAEHRVVLPVTPNTCGDARFSLDVICRVGQAGDIETHTATLQVAVDANTESAFNPVFNISQNQTSDRAGDSKGGSINVNLGGLQIIQQENSSRYETPSSGFVPLDVQLKASPARLTLKGPDDVLQLVSDDCITFGRNRGNTIPLRICGEDGTVDRAANEHNISRFHFRIERSASDCIVSDGDNEAPSSYGTRIDDAAIPPKGSKRIAPDRDVVIEAGHIGRALKMHVKFHRDEWGRPAGFLMERCDGARQRICAAWREVPLNGSERVSWSGSRWMYSGGDNVTVPLVVGTTVSVGGKPFVVLPFRQTHVR